MDKPILFHVKAINGEIVRPVYEETEKLYKVYNEENKMFIYVQKELYKVVEE